MALCMAISNESIDLRIFLRLLGGWEGDETRGIPQRRATSEGVNSSSTTIVSASVRR